MFRPDPATGGMNITKSDSTVYNPPLKALWVGGVGDVTVITPQGTSVLFTVAAVPAIIPMVASKVMSAGTSATNIVGFID